MCSLRLLKGLGIALLPKVVTSVYGFNVEVGKLPPGFIGKDRLRFCCGLNS